MARRKAGPQAGSPRTVDGADAAPARAGGRGAGPRRGDGDDELSLLEVVNALLRHRWRIVLLCVVAAAAGIALALVRPATYTSTASFMAQGGESRAGNLAGLASQFGFSIPIGEAGESPQFYAQLLRSREILGAAVEAGYRGAGPRSESGRETATLVELYDPDGDSPAERREEAIERLREDLAIDINLETGVVELAVTTAWAPVSEQVSRRLLDLLNSFNLGTRQSQASAERTFIEGRLEEARAALKAAEDSLSAFLERNRRYDNSPELRFAHERLQRQVGLEQQLVTSLTQSYEQARIEEVRNTPVITTIESPNRPLEADPRGLPLHAVLGALVGIFGGVVWSLGSEFAGRARREDPERWEEFLRLQGGLREDLSRAWRRLRGRWGPSD